jgi:hypothetical protein
LAQGRAEKLMALFTSKIQIKFAENLGDLAVRDRVAFEIFTTEHFYLKFLKLLKKVCNVQKTLQF